MLLLLFSGQRLQKLYTLKVSNIHVSTSGCSIFLDSLFNTSRPHSHKSRHLKFNYYSDTHLCVIAHIERHISLIQSLKETTASLFASYCKPYKPVSKDTIGRWVGHLMQELTLKPIQSTALEQLQYQKDISLVYQWNRSLLQHPGPMQKHLPNYFTTNPLRQLKPVFWQ